VCVCVCVCVCVHAHTPAHTEEPTLHKVPFLSGQCVSVLLCMFGAVSMCARVVVWCSVLQIGCDVVSLGCLHVCTVGCVWCNVLQSGAVCCSVPQSVGSLLRV